MIELIQSHPRISIVIISALISLFISLINFFVMDKKKVREMRGKQKKLAQEIKAHKDNPAKMMEIQKEMMENTMQTLRHSLKPILITMIPVLIAFTWIRGVFSETTLAGSWLWWYIISAIIASIIFRKLLKLP